MVSKQNYKKIIYIIGAGRSGTTILDILLGNGEDILSAGEINRYAIRGGVPTYWCHIKDSPTFLFWQQVGDLLKKRFSSSSEELDFAQLTTISQKYEYHTGIIKSKKKEEFAIYQNFILNLYAAIFDNITQNTIIDSSKYPYRALQLAQILPYEIQFIYLKRDPRGVIASFAKTDIPNENKSWLSANVFYLIVNLLCQFAVHRLKQKHTVVEMKYEDLVAQPVESLERLEKQLNINLQPVIEKIREDDFLNVGPLFEGNRMRMTDKVKLTVKQKTEYPNNIKNMLTRWLNFIVYR